ncbi:hypothetical protein [Streptomyces violascens]|uniref:hypothetical protein n=1 Tax=Streptomyces violascens TaxID=67381 RepID=UPI00167B041D|nr:hypothetical protein [Streptomyces violascens]GGU38706.1 hypothetical protein GCM10010289_69460 [Streptomyces violascens]
MPYTPDPAQVRRVALRLLDQAREEIDSVLVDDAITDDLLNGEAVDDGGEARLTGEDVKVLHRAVTAAVRSAQVLLAPQVPLYSHAGHACMPGGSEGSRPSHELSGCGTRMSLPVETVAYRQVEFEALEGLIRCHYGLEYSVIRALGVSNGSYCRVEAWAEPLDPDEAGEIAAWLAGGAEPHLASVLNDLAYSRVIDSGEYLVHVWW